MNATEAKELLLPIPKEDFLEHHYSDGKGKCCAVGHLCRLSSDNPDDYKLENCTDAFGSNNTVSDFARDQVFDYLSEAYSIELIKKGQLSEIWKSPNLAHVNNQPTINGFTQSNPKDRAIALLDEMIEAGY